MCGLAPVQDLVCVSLSSRVRGVVLTQVLAVCFGLWGLNLQPTLNFCSEIVLWDRFKSFRKLSCMLSSMISMVLVRDTEDKI